jgi:peroxiredoxin
MSKKGLKNPIFLYFALLFLSVFSSKITAGNDGLTVGETIPNPEFYALSKYDLDQMPRQVRLYDYKEGKNLLIAFMPDISDKNNYAKVMTTAFDTYFAEGLAFRNNYSFTIGDGPELQVLVVTNNNEAEVSDYLRKLDLDFEMASDNNLDFANFFGINKWNSSTEGSHVYIVNSDNKIIYASHDYKGEGEKLKTVQKELFTLAGLNTDLSAAEYLPLVMGDEARDFSFSYVNTDGMLENPDIMRDGNLSDYLGKKNVLLAFYPAPYSYSCGMEVARFDSYAEDKLLQKVVSENIGSGDDLEILMVSLSNSSILTKWKNEMDLKNVKLISDYTGDISMKYSSYNLFGYNKRTIFLIDKSGKVSYIDWDYKVDDDDFTLIKEHLISMN